jgi:glutathione S-transferase
MDGDLELYQAEWCPFSHVVRLRLTELQVDFTARQVPVDPDERDELARRTGSRSIPALVVEGGVVTGSDEILAFLDEHFAEPPGVALHRAKMRADWPLWLRLHGAARR